MSVQVCRMNVLAYPMNGLDAPCALAYRMNVMAYPMNALLLELLRELDGRYEQDVRCEQLGALKCDAQVVRCALSQTLLHESSAYRPY
jgi:hypothetical protein